MRKRKQDRQEHKDESVEAIDPAEGESQRDEFSSREESPPNVAEQADAVDEEGHVAIVETPEAAIQRLSEEVQEERERWLRLAAEFDNFRKRVERQRGEIRNNARAEIVRSILETIDNLARVTALEGTEAGAEDVIAGVKMVERGLMRELEGAGLVKIGDTGEQFDPNDHEAVSTATAPSDDEVDCIAEVLQVGYRFGDILLRPARVQVYIAPKAEDGVGD